MSWKKYGTINADSQEKLSLFYSNNYQFDLGDAKKKPWRLILIQMADQAENCCSIVGHLSSEKIHKERHLVIPNFIDTCLFPTRRQSSTWQIDPVMQVISSHFR